MTVRRSIAAAAVPALSALVLAIAVAAPSVAGAATGAGPTFGPDVVTAKANFTITSSIGEPYVGYYHWAGIDHFRSIGFETGDPTHKYLVDVDHGVETTGLGLPARLLDASRTAAMTDVAPDAVDHFSADVLGWGAPLLARERSGQDVLASAKFDGRAVLRGRVRLAANGCTSERAGVRTVDLDAHTLLPVHVVDSRHGVVTLDETFDYGLSGSGAFRPLHALGQVGVERGTFVRSTPAQAAAVLRFPVSMPTSLPAGYRLDHAGHATKGENIGPNDGWAPSSGLYAARFSRGAESIELTIRKAAGKLAGQWDSGDPFTESCETDARTSVQVGTAAAHYSIGEFGQAHLWWRSGTTLYTLAGTLSSDQLVAVANSLAPVAS